MKSIRVADFTTLPGPRYVKEGPNSGEEFRETRLKPAFAAAQAAKEPLQIELDGAEFGYPASFLEESFGGLARDLGIECVQGGLAFVSNDEPLLEKEIRGYISNANESKPPAQRAKS